MADKTLSSLVGGGLGLRVVDHTSGTISAGVTGNILTINAPNANSVVRLSLLNCASTSSQSGISLTIDGNMVWDQLLLNDNGNPDDNAVSVRSHGAVVSVPGSINGYIGVLYDVFGKNIVVNKNAGNTTQAIIYSYQIMEPIT